MRWDRVDYYHEVRHLEEVVIELHLAAASDDLTRFRFANPILQDGEWPPWSPAKAAGSTWPPDA